jgi:hypothetical protein
MSRIDIIRKLMTSTGNDKLLYFLFPDADAVEDYGSFSMDLERVNANIGVYSGGEQILCRVAMDIWGEYGDAKLFDICRRLDGENFLAVLTALAEWRAL